MVIALKDKDKVVVLSTIADVVEDISTYDMALVENVPGWKVRGTKDCFVFADSVKYAVDLLRCHNGIFKNITDGNSVIADVVPQMKELLDRYACIYNNREWDASLVVVKGNKIFTINRYFIVSEVDDFVGVGYDSYLNGALEESADIPTEDRLMFAVDHVCKMCNKSLFPLVLFDTKSQKRNVIYK